VRRFSREDGLPDESISSLRVATDGRLYVGTLHGLAWWRDGAFHASAAASLQGVRYSQSLDFDAHGQLFLATPQGLQLSAPPAGDLAPRPAQGVQGAPGPRSTVVLAGATAAVWYGCGTKLCALEGGQLSVWGPAEGVPEQIWTALLRDAQGRVWARSRMKLISLDAGARRFIEVPVADVGPWSLGLPLLAQDSSGRLMVPTNQGLAVHDARGWRKLGVAQGLPMREVSAVFQDREGSLWLGTIGAGLYRWTGYGEWESFTANDGLSGDLIMTLARESADRIWVGTTGGLDRLTRTGDRWNVRRMTPPGATWVNASARTPDGSLWFSADESRIFRYRPATSSWHDYGAHPGRTGLYADRAGVLWIPGRHNLLRLAPPYRPGSFESLDPSRTGQDAYWNAAGTADGSLWCGSPHGLWRLHAGAWRVYTQADGLLSERVQSVSAAPDGAVWVAYDGPLGLTRFNVSGDRVTATHFGTGQGLASLRVYSAEFDPTGAMWVLTDRGVDGVRDGRWQLLDRSRGLAWNDTTARAFLASPDGSYWIGTSRGLSHYQPAPNSPPPPALSLHWTQLCFGAECRPFSASAQQLRSRERSLRLGFAALRFNGESALRYRYRLLGADDNWKETTVPEAVFSSLPPGNYRLQAEVRSLADAEASPMLELAFRLTPAWYESAYVRWGGAALLLALGAAYLWRRSSRSRAAQALLEGMVDERTRELHHATLRLEEQIAELERNAREREQLEARLLESRKMEAVGRLAGGVAHEFNNLLTVINGYSDLLAKQAAPDSPTLFGLNEISAAGERAALLTRQLLTFGRRQVVQPELVDLNAQLDALRGMVARMAGQDIQVRWVFAPALSPLRADRGQLMTICLNLVANARDAMADGGTLWIETRPGDLGAAPAVVWEFRDTGVGMDEETRSHIFEPFFTTKGVGQGTGLGMASVYAIVKQLEGQIQVESRRGAGTTVRIRLPGQSVPAQLGAQEQSAQGAPGPPEPSPTSVLKAPDPQAVVQIAPGAAVVLVVDDQEDVRSFCAALLRSQGYAVREASDAESALAAVARDGPPDLLLTDIVMPGLSGLELAATLRERAPALAVLLMSGYTEIPEEESSTDQPILPKPFTPEQLAASVHLALNRRHRTA
jgi:signal transduction histidine kinase/ligand-binding sensor domain-containing protein/CheY-like chemotaxis protein